MIYYVGAGQTKDEQFTVTLDDGHGAVGTVTQTVDVTIVGTNQAPIIGAAKLTGAVTDPGINFGPPATVAIVAGSSTQQASQAST